jgi:hypothetical protein
VLVEIRVLLRGLLVSVIEWKKMYYLGKLNDKVIIMRFNKAFGLILIALVIFLSFSGSVLSVAQQNNAEENLYNYNLEIRDLTPDNILEINNSANESIPLNGLIILTNVSNNDNSVNNALLNITFDNQEYNLTTNNRGEVKLNKLNLGFNHTGNITLDISFTDEYNNSVDFNHTFEVKESKNIELDPYDDLGFKKFDTKRINFNEIPEGNGEWHHVRTIIMPNFNNDLNDLKGVMDFNAKHADELYTKGILNYSSGSKGRFQHVPIQVTKDMYYYDSKYDAYETIIMSYLDEFNGLMTPLAIGLSAGTAALGVASGICVACSGTAVTVATQDGGTATAVQTTFWLKFWKVVGWVGGILGASGAVATGVVAGVVANDKKNLANVWKKYANYHGDMKLEVPYIHNDNSKNSKNIPKHQSVNYNNITSPVNTNISSGINLYVSTDNQLGDPTTDNRRGHITNDLDDIISFISFDAVRDWGNWMSWGHKDYAPDKKKIDKNAWRKVKWYCLWNALINAGVGITLGLWWVSYTIVFGVSYIGYCFFWLGYNLVAGMSFVVSVPKLVNSLNALKPVADEKAPNLSNNEPIKQNSNFSITELNNTINSKLN